MTASRREHSVAEGEAAPSAASSQGPWQLHPGVQSTQQQQQCSGAPGPPPMALGLGADGAPVAPAVCTVPLHSQSFQGAVCEGSIAVNVANVTLAHANGQQQQQRQQQQQQQQEGALPVKDLAQQQSGMSEDVATGTASAGRQWLSGYFQRWRGAGGNAGPMESWENIAWAFLGAFIAILALALANEFGADNTQMITSLVASFGASAVLVFGVPEAKFSQPRNLVGGQLVCALTGWVVRLIFYAAPQRVLPVSAALGMAAANVLMLATRTVHPPGGATALIAASVVDIGDWQGFKFVISVLWACCIMLAAALVINNLPAGANTKRRYPQYWW